MRTHGTLRLATRGSALARRQASLVKEALEDRRYEVELVTVETTGDQIRDELIHRLGKTGAFVRELDERVLEEDLDGAIHSMKDMPTEQPEELVTAAVPERGEPGDALVTPDGATLEELPAGATVGTSSLRRRAQLLSERADLAVEPCAGTSTRASRSCSHPPCRTNTRSGRKRTRSERGTRGTTISNPSTTAPPTSGSTTSRNSRRARSVERSRHRTTRSSSRRRASSAAGSPTTSTIRSYRRRRSSRHRDRERSR